MCQLMPHGSLQVTQDKTGDFIAFPAIYNTTKQLSFYEASQFTEKTAE